MLRRPLAVLLLVAWSTAAAQTHRPAPPPAVARDFSLVRAEYSGANALDVVAFMDHYFRVPGNTGFNASLDRVRDILERAGYQPESTAAPGARLTYRIETRPLRGPTWEPVDASLSIVGQDSALLRFATNRNMLAIDSYSTPAGGVIAPLVFAGSGSPAELDSAHVAGKVVLVAGPVRRVFADAVTARGAVGVLGYSMPGYTQPDVHTHSIQFTQIPLDSVHRSWAMPLSKAAYDALRAALDRGPVQVHVETATKIYPSVERTLIAEVLGNVSPDQRFVFSAHVQEPGANDNASGVGTQAEMARTLAALLRRGAIDPGRTITMIWGNEIEQTRNFLADDSVRRRDIHWGVSLDMTGENTAKTGGTFLIEKMPDPSAVWTRGDDHHTAWGGSPVPLSMLHPHYFNDFILDRCLDQAAATGWVVNTNPYEGGSDHTPYIEYHKPGLLFWHFTDVYYHTDGDRLSMVSADEMKNVGVSALVSALTLTSADGPTTRALVSQIEGDGRSRLDREYALSAAAVKAGGPAAHEVEILSAWKAWYVGAIRAMTDIELGGTSPETGRAIDAGAADIGAYADSLIAKLTP
ncbi:MAG: M28 family peptidase [Gemmatimonadota bacterium]|nr:M28 family peptidase [Gemmatimonadota bacterium]